MQVYESLRYVGIKTVGFLHIIYSRMIHICKFTAEMHRIPRAINSYSVNINLLSLNCGVISLSLSLSLSLGESGTENKHGFCPVV